MMINSSLKFYVRMRYAVGTNGPASPFRSAPIGR